jgi:hypothetical protein
MFRCSSSLTKFSKLLLFCLTDADLCCCCHQWAACKWSWTASRCSGCPVSDSAATVTTAFAAIKSSTRPYGSHESSSHSCCLASWPSEKLFTCYCFLKPEWDRAATINRNGSCLQSPCRANNATLCHSHCLIARCLHLLLQEARCSRHHRRPMHTIDVAPAGRCEDAVAG